MIITDARRRSFLDSLDDADFDVDPWEAKFLESNIDRQNFTLAQRESIDRMIRKYGHRLDW
ncbi:MAG: hypothetical protein JXR37_09110 [Kiritimatiellae bacterium]|nr:hypothetical protein [Kiritimatiellia bacterium]